MSATVILVHGAWADGSGWQGIYDQLTAAGMDVRVTQHSTKTLTDDDATVRNLIDSLPDDAGPVVLVGHSYGGAVITQAGTHEKVAALVYLTAFAPDTGETMQQLLGTFPTDGPLPPTLPPANGFILLDRSKFVASFAADVEEGLATFMRDAQVPWGLTALGEPIVDAAWHHRPVWYLHATDDLMIPPSAQLRMAQRMGATIVDSPGSHAVYVSNPTVCADLIKTAVAAVE